MSHIVICLQCGRRFDIAREGGGYNSTKRRYYCKKCYKQIQAQEKQAKREQDIANGIDVNKKWWKIALGILFIFSGIYGIGQHEPVVVIVCILVGLLFFYLYFKNDIQKLRLKNKVTDEDVKEEVQPLEKWICKHCGATTSGKTCEYCDSPKD